jgi:hypothetical protein
MKKIITILVVIILMVSSLKSFCQDIDLLEGKEKLETQKIAFITQKLNLTIEESQIFWPVYNEFTNKKQQIQTKRRDMLKNIAQNFKTMPDAEIEKASDVIVALEMEEATLAQEYHAKFKKALPIKKVLKYYQAENQFKKFLLRELKNRQDNPDRKNKELKQDQQGEE